MLFNGANVFLLCLIGLTLWNCALNIQINKTDYQKETLASQIRVLDVTKNTFNQLEYTVLKDGGIWSVTSAKVLDIGHEYQVSGVFEQSSVQGESIKNYRLSLGIIGRGVVKAIMTKKTGCDIICQTIISNYQTKRTLKNTLYNGICREPVAKIFYSGVACGDIFGLSQGLVLGGSQDFSDVLKKDFKRLGLTHLVAVSGFQVVLVVSFLESMFVRVQMRRSLRVFLGIIGIIFLVALVGPQPPVIRSGISIGLSSLVLLGLGRRIESFRVLIYSALVMLWLNPLYILSLSFQLSFLASLGLVVSSGVETPLSTKKGVSREEFLAENRRIESNQLNKLSKFASGFIELIKTTIFAFLFTLPPIVNISGQVSLLAIPTNILVIPMIPFVTLLNILGLIPVIGQLSLFLTTAIQSLLITAIHDLASLPITLKLSPFSPTEMIFYYAILISLVGFSKLFSIHIFRSAVTTDFKQ